MELKKILILFIFILFSNSLKAELVEPNDKLAPFDVIKIQLEALKNNNDQDQGIKQTWLFAHPDNKKITGPYERFRIMIYSQQYKYLLNHSSHTIDLVMNSPSKFIYKVKILASNKQLLFYEWHVQKASDEKCQNCWYTSAVSQPVDQGNTI
tara:strand:- start:561 stop:1016 length:456 start_codon:yes stop_codon:yes gene_type:complete